MFRYIEEEILCFKKQWPILRELSFRLFSWLMSARRWAAFSFALFGISMTISARTRMPVSISIWKTHIITIFKSNQSTVNYTMRKLELNRTKENFLIEYLLERLSRLLLEWRSLPDEDFFDGDDLKHRFLWKHNWWSSNKIILQCYNGNNKRQQQQQIRSDYVLLFYIITVTYRRIQ